MLWFNDQAEEAVNLYTNIFNDSKILNKTSRPDGGVFTVDFELLGAKYTALNGGDMFTFTEAFSIFILCNDQSEVDRYWDALIANGAYYASKLKDFRILLSSIALTLTISFTAFTFDSGWHLIVWLFISNFAFAFAFPLCLVLTVTRSVEAGETRSLSIMAQSVGYLMAAFSPGIVAGIFDLSHSWNAALFFVIGIGVILIGVGYKAGSPEKIVI